MQEQPQDPYSQNQNDPYSQNPLQELNFGEPLSLSPRFPQEKGERRRSANAVNVQGFGGVLTATIRFF